MLYNNKALPHIYPYAFTERYYISIPTTIYTHTHTYKIKTLLKRDIAILKKDTIEEGVKMIPKKIHYIWFGRGEKNERMQKCIESWKKFLPDYEIIEWNEDNFDVNYNEFTKKAYEEGKYAYVSDVARLWVLYNEGGIYMDVDVEVYKPLDEFLNEEAFTGFEDVHYPVTATLGAEAGNPVIKMMLDYYDCREFIKYDNWTDYITYQETNTCIMSNILGMLGIDRDRNEEQHIKHFSVYPRSYFFTKDEGWTYHSFNGSW